MYRSIYIPVDNSAHALHGVDIGIAIARQTGATLTGSHVYAAKLHDRRFRQMEGGLPDRYLKQEKLQEQREVHEDLITRGLRIVSDSYLDVFGRKCEEAGVPCQRVSLEGRNWQKLADDVQSSRHDLVIMGALGLGAVEASLLGSVCERVARRIDRDLLAVKSLGPDRPGAIVAAIDGSAHSYGALKTALELGRIFGRPVEAVSVFDPFFHYVAFHRIAGVLSAEAASVFRFEEQEKLHEEIIDNGLARIYQAHLDLAVKVASEAGVELPTTLLAGKTFEQILKYVRQHEPWLLALGRIGAHSDRSMDLGSNTENLLRLAGCHLLLSARTCEPAPDQVAETNVAWTGEATARMGRVPPSVRGMAAKMVIRHAVERGHTVITSDLIDACLESLMASRGDKARAGAVARNTSNERVGAGVCPFAHLAGRRKK
ncbi:MAG: universal stress protein [Betaproteobacteria bacterium]|nr:universal stress protein [Betaproteobacteria bacterium]